MGVIGTRSTMLIIREAWYGTTRFDDFAARVGITDAITSARLKELVQAGILVKRPYRPDKGRTRHEYVLTHMGDDLVPIVLSLMQWGDTYLQESAPLSVVDEDSGDTVRVSVTTASGAPVDIDRLHLRVAQESPTTVGSVIVTDAEES